MRMCAELVIRPSGSKGADHLNITIRFAPDTYLNVDVEEHRDPDQPRTALGRRPVQAQESFFARTLLKVAQHSLHHPLAGSRSARRSTRTWMSWWRATCCRSWTPPRSCTTTASTWRWTRRRPVQSKIRVLLFSARALNATGQSRVTLSPQEEHSRAVCGQWQEERVSEIRSKNAPRRPSPAGGR